MRFASRRLLLASLSLLVSPVGQTRWQESGWIGTCPGIGCAGNRVICATYTVTLSDGTLRKNYCYFDP